MIFVRGWFGLFMIPGNIVNGVKSGIELSTPGLVTSASSAYLHFAATFEIFCNENVPLKIHLPGNVNG